MNPTFKNIIKAEAEETQEAMLTTMTEHERIEYEKLSDKAAGIWDHFRSILSKEDFKKLMELESVETSKDDICKMHMFHQGVIKGISSGLTKIA